MNLSLRRFIIDVFPMTTLLILLTALKFLRCRKGCKSHNLLIYTLYCGERGIRTPGTSQFNGFQDRRNRPLCHLSSGRSPNAMKRSEP